MTVKEINDKIARAKANTVLTDAQKTQIVAKPEKDLATLESGDIEKTIKKGQENLLKMQKFWDSQSIKVREKILRNSEGFDDQMLIEETAGKTSEEIEKTEDYKFLMGVFNAVFHYKEKKPSKPKPKKPTALYKGKSVKDLSDDECEEMRKEVESRRKKQAKSEKKSKSRPVIEKVAANVVTGAKQVIKNISAADIKDDPKKEIAKMEKLEATTRKYLSEMRSILGEDYDKETIDGEIKDLHKVIVDLKKKYS